MTTVWHNFQANTCSKKSSAWLFWVSWSKRMLWRFFPRVLFSSCSRQWNSNGEKRTRNCNCITITRYYQWSSWSNERSWHFSHCITLSFFTYSYGIRSLRCSRFGRFTGFNFGLFTITKDNNIFDESRVTRKNGLCSQLNAAEK